MGKPKLTLLRPNPPRPKRPYHTTIHAEGGRLGGKTQPPPPLSAGLVNSIGFVVMILPSNHQPPDQPILISLGDPVGIGPEVILKALAHPSLEKWQLAKSCRLVGSGEHLEATYRHLKTRLDPALLANPRDFEVVDVPLPPGLTLTWGQPSAVTGDLSFQYLNRAVDLALAGQGRAIVTGPIAKSHWHQAGHYYPGQTELLTEKAGVSASGMLFVAISPHTGWILRTLLATTHIPLAEVPHQVTPDRLDTKLDLLIQALKTHWGLEQPRIAVAGLNPHSGEQGQLGREEVDHLQAWLQRAQDRYPQVQLTGLYPPDTLWIKPGQAWWTDPSQGHDAYLALYHDQGLIPVKLLAFDRAVNTTIGLPILRTSPDHGTAFDIAGLGIAQADSTIAALQLALTLT